MSLLQHYQVSLLLTTAVTTTVGIWIFLQKRTSKVTQTFFVYSLAVGFWSWCQAQIASSSNSVEALAWGRTMFYAVITFPVLLTHFIAAFLKTDRRKACLLGWLLVIGFLPVLSSDMFLREGGALGIFPFFPRTGPLFLPFNLAWIGWVIYDLLLLARGPLGETYPTRKQVKIVLFAFIFGYLTGCTNYFYFYGIYLPPLQPIASYGAPIGFLLIAYGVFAYALFDINVVFRKSLVYSLLITLLTVGYFALIYGIERIFQTAFGYKSVWVSLAAFALMALAFQPLKLWIQRWVDWLIFRVPQEQLVKRIERLELENRQTEKLKSVSTLASGLCHELRNPLQTIYTYAEYLPERYDDSSFRKNCSEAMRTEIARINDLLKQLMDFARPKPPALQSLEPHRILDSTLNLLSNELFKRKISLDKKYEANGTKIQADPDQLRQVILNLVLNALQAIGKEGRVTVRTTQENGWFTLEISDTGPGIDSSVLPRLFEPFTTTKLDGNGLGLSVVHSIIQEHKGQISAQSQPGISSTFIVRLPAE